MKFVKVAVILVLVLAVGGFVGYKFIKYLRAPIQHEVVDLWKGNPPSVSDLTGDEVASGVYGEWVTNVTKAELYIFKAKNKKDGRVVIICPAGGYVGLSMLHEGVEWGRWLQGKGITAIVLKYRMPNGNPPVVIDDLTEAIKYVRENADELQIDPNKLGLMGLSAGAHLATYVATQEAERVEGIRPNYMMLFYPVITMDESIKADTLTRNALLGSSITEEMVNEFSVERHVTKDTPRAFITLCEDDPLLDPSNGLMYCDSLRSKGVDVTLELYPEGGHSWGTKANFKYTKEMTESLSNWLDSLY